MCRVEHADTDELGEATSEARAGFCRVGAKKEEE
jgi:hypothetical protein